MSDPQEQNGDIRINPFGDRKKKSSNLTKIFTTIDDKPKVRGISDSYLVKMLGRFLKPYWWQLLAVLGLLFAASGLQLLLPYLIKVTVDGPITNGTMDGLIPIGVGYIVAIFGIFALRFAYTYWLQTIGQGALANLRQELYEHIMTQDIRYFNNTPVGKVVARMSNDIEALTELLSTSIVILAANLITLVGIIGVMLWLNWRLALISLTVIPLMVVLSLYFRMKIRRIASRFHRIMAAYQAYLNEQFNGMLVVQLFNRQHKTLDDFSTINQDYFDAHMDIRDVYTYYGSLLQILTTIGLAVVLWGGGQGVISGWEGVTIGVLIAFIEYVRQSYEPIIMLSEQFTQIQTAFSAGERIARMLQVQPDVQEPAKPRAVTSFDQSIEFRDVTFGYKDGHPVLKGINLKIEPGQRVAIVGATGAGKTTLVKLLARYYDVDEGGIGISGVDIRDLSFDDLRRYITVVPQDPYCFNGTIANNLQLFDPKISDEEMDYGAEIACAKPFIDKLPGGYDFELLPGGGNLSQGQRQLLALARAIIHSPESILVLDEATSSIDTETEEYIQQGLERILQDRTSLIIAHRLSTVRDADRIIVMRDGQVIEDGSHDDLLELGGMYAQLYYRQFADPDASIDDLLEQSDTVPEAS
jgi:ATP-binding cassette, subfamily B, multidrug efflux pump